MAKSSRAVASPRVVNIEDLRPLAQRRLPRAVFDYLDGGADGEVTRKVRRQYVFRLYNGFTDVADNAFERLWAGATLTWAELQALCAECKAADPRPEPKQKSAIRKESLRAPS